MSDLKVMTQAGGKLRAVLVAEFASYCRQKGMHFYVMYGAAEARRRDGLSAVATGTGKAG